jgi:hypothetical protein
VSSLPPCVPLGRVRFNRFSSSQIFLLLHGAHPPTSHFCADPCFAEIELASTPHVEESRRNFDLRSEAEPDCPCASAASARVGSGLCRIHDSSESRSEGGKPLIESRQRFAGGFPHWFGRIRSIRVSFRTLGSVWLRH